MVEHPGMVICVLGAPRSGTSLTSRLLNLLGMDLGKPESLVAPNRINPEGFWENRRIVHLNKEIIQRMGGTRYAPLSFRPGWESRPGMAELLERAAAILREEFEGKTLWGWKDPQNCLTLPFWHRRLPQMNHVVCIRHPLDVARSLGLPNAMNLWLASYRAAVRDMGNRPRLVVRYEDYFAHPWESIARLAAFIAAPVDEEKRVPLARTINESLWHHHHRREYDLKVPPDVRALFQELCSLIPPYE